MRIGEMRKGFEHLYHLPCPLPAGNDHYDIDIGIFGEVVLQNRLAGPKRSGSAKGASLNEGKLAVDDALPRVSHLCLLVFLSDARYNLNRPALPHPEFSPRPTLVPPASHNGL